MNTKNKIQLDNTEIEKHFGKEKEIEIEAKENILNRKILEATEIISRAEKILNEKEKVLIDFINPNIDKWKNRKKIFGYVKKLIDFGINLNLEQFTLKLSDIDINNLNNKDIKSIVEYILKLVDDDKFSKLFEEILEFISKDKIDFDNLTYKNIFDLLKGFFLFIKTQIN